MSPASVRGIDARHLVAHAAGWLDDEPGLVDVEGRASTVDVALSRISAWAARYGVSRVAEATGLDRTGIPNAYAVRPAARHPCGIVASGKGLSMASAKAGALFESFERWSAEVAPPAWAAPGDIPGIGRRSAAIGGTAAMGWTAGIDPFDGTPLALPVARIVFPVAAQGAALAGGETASTDGLAAGTSPLEAITAGIFELVERGTLRRIEDRALERIDETAIGGPAGEVAAAFAAAGIELAVYRCRGLLDVPVFYAITADDQLRHSAFFCCGSGCHLDPSTALLRALLEVSQSRASFISGLRPDVSLQVRHWSEVAYDDRRAELDRWFSAPREFAFDALPAAPRPGFAPLLAALEERIGAALGPQAVAFVPLARLEGLYAGRALGLHPWFGT